MISSQMGGSSLFKKEDLAPKVTESNIKKNIVIEESKGRKESKEEIHNDVSASTFHQVNKINPFEPKPDKTEKKLDIVVQTENMPKAIIEPPVQNVV